MCAVRQMNRRWRQHGLTVCGGEPIEALAYDIVPLGAQAGLVEEVPDSQTLQELSQGYSMVDRHLRVLRCLRNDPKRLDRLAATTVGYLTMSYVLGIRDGHDENLMLRSDGSFFRVDFGFAFGETPEIDAPSVFVPRAVSHALGPERWADVVHTAGLALRAISGDGVRTLSLAGPTAMFGTPGETPPGWDLLRCVEAMGPFLGRAKAHANTLSFERFEREARQADEWSLSRTAKNTLRQAMRYLALAQREPEAAGAPKAGSPKDWLGALDPLSLMCKVSAANRALPMTRTTIGALGEGGL